MPRNGSVYGVVFPSQLGWMAALARGETLLRLTFQHNTPAAATTALKRSTALHSDDWQPPSDRWHPFVAPLVAYAQGEFRDLGRIDIDAGPMTTFQRRVIDGCRTIPYGQTRNYAQLAAAVGSPGAARAVGNVMAANRLPLVVPCHRVVASGGSLGGYSAPGGLEVKRRLLALESTASPQFALVSG